MDVFVTFVLGIENLVNLRRKVWIIWQILSDLLHFKLLSHLLFMNPIFIFLLILLLLDIINYIKPLIIKFLLLPLKSVLLNPLLPLLILQSTNNILLNS